MKSQTELQPVDSLLSGFKGHTAFFQTYPGNNGDRLIHLGSHLAFKEAGLRMVGNSKKADVIILTGGGGMSDIWKVGFVALERQALSNPKAALIVLPSSFHITETNFPSLLRNRSAPTFVYAREKQSFEVLRQLALPTGVHVGIDHDMALRLEASQFLGRLKQRSAAKYTLVVERGDEESVKDFRHDYIITPDFVAGSFLSRWARTSVPRDIRLPIRRWILGRLHRQRNDPQEHTEQALRAFQESFPGFPSLPVHVADISMQEYCSFHTFGRSVAEAAAVISSRLHVGILAALLGKPTLLREDRTGKVRGVYEYSLKELPHVRMSP